MLGTWVLSDNNVDEYSTAPESIELLPNGVCRLYRSKSLYSLSSSFNWVWFRRNDIVLLCEISESGYLRQKAIFILKNGLKYYDDHCPGNGMSIRPDVEYDLHYRSYTRTNVISGHFNENNVDNSDLIGRWETERYTPEGTSIIVYKFLEFRENGQHTYGQYSSTGGAGFAHYTHSDWLWVRYGNLIMTFVSEATNGGGWLIDCYKLENGRIPNPDSIILDSYRRVSLF